ncbi:MAG: tRNA (guanine-N1)-methyltransferase [Flavobacteriaceae bacterium]|nr:tRNA (guanine-N1)-methyltransferase [Flavobacteriaceae bacterium]
MKITKKSLLVITTLLICIISFGQAVKNQELINKALSSESIENQFTILISKSPSFQNFKNIRQLNLNKFSKNFKDSLIAATKKFNNAQLKIQTQKTEIKKLNEVISTANTDLTKASEDKDSIGLFGLRMSKAIYNSILWSIILGLLITTLFFLFRFKSSHSVTKNAKSTLAEIEDEFETHKKNSLEREQVLRRKLQDEINKQRNVK